MTKREALKEVKRRWVPQGYVEYDRRPPPYNEKCSVGIFDEKNKKQVGLFVITEFRVMGAGKSWKEAFTRADASCAEAERKESNGDEPEGEKKRAPGS